MLILGEIWKINILGKLFKNDQKSFFKGINWFSNGILKIPLNIFTFHLSDFFKIVFSNKKIDMKKVIFFDDVFSKTYSWSRRIHLKRFQSDSGSLKIRKRAHKISWQKKNTRLVHLVPLKKIVAIWKDESDARQIQMEMLLFSG